MIFLIEQIWIDPMENEINSAYGYKPIGYVEHLVEAYYFFNKGKRFTNKDCWAIPPTGLPEYKATVLNNISNQVK